MYVYSFHHHIINSFFDLLFRSIIFLSQKKRKKNRPPSSFIHSFIHSSFVSSSSIIIMSSSPSTTHTTKKVFVSSSPGVVKTVLFGVLASTVIASFAFASENAHILVQQVRDSTRVFSLSSRFPDRIQPPMMRESSPLLRADDAIFDSHPLSLFVHNNNNNNNNRPYRKTRSSKARTSPSLSRPRTRD